MIHASLSNDTLFEGRIAAGESIVHLEQAVDLVGFLFAVREVANVMLNRDDEGQITLSYNIEVGEPGNWEHAHFKLTPYMGDSQTFDTLLGYVRQLWRGLSCRKLGTRDGLGRFLPQPFEKFKIILGDSIRSGAYAPQEFLLLP